MGVFDRLMHSWNVFRGRDFDTYGAIPREFFGSGYGNRPDRVALNAGSTRTILGGIINRISIDVASTSIRHVRNDEDGRYQETLKSSLNTCLTVEANLDQGATAFRQDMARTMLDRGVIAVVPVESDLDPEETGGYNIKNVRVGHILQWYPKHITVSLWNEETGRRQEITVPKNICAIIENPLSDVMNEPNSILQRLIRKLSILDQIDEQAGSGKLDLIIQLPYVIKSEARRKEAEKRRKDIEVQLQGSQYGIAYTDGTEHITQLNRPAENNMLKHVEYLSTMLYGQLGLTPGVFDGTASESEMINYENRTIKPILTVITEEFKRKFLTKTARSQGQSVEYFSDPFKHASVSSLAELADKFTRNEILSSNEVRSVIGFKPSSDPKANQLVNANISQAKTEIESPEPIELKQIKDDSSTSKEVESLPATKILEELKKLKNKEGMSQNGRQA